MIIEARAIIGINSLVTNRHLEWTNLILWTPKETKGTHPFTEMIKINLCVHSLMIFLKNRLLIITKCLNYLSLGCYKETLWLLNRINNKKPVFKCNTYKIKIKSKKKWWCRVIKANLQSLSLKIWSHRC